MLQRDTEFIGKNSMKELMANRENNELRLELMQLETLPEGVSVSSTIFCRAIYTRLASNLQYFVFKCRVIEIFLKGGEPGFVDSSWGCSLNFLA